EASYTVKADVSDAAGNAATQATQAFTTEDTTAPGDGDGENAISFETNGDAYLNKDESGSVDLTGKVEAGASVVGIVITDSSASGNTFTVPVSSISVDANGNVSVEGLDLSSLVDGSLTVSMSVVDAAGNEGSVTNTAILDTSIVATLVIDDVTPDDTVNAEEANSIITLTGSINLEDDASVTSIVLNINGSEYTVLSENINADGVFSVDVNGSDLANDVDRTIEYSAEIQDVAGNVHTITSSDDNVQGIKYRVDVSAPDAPVVTIEADLNNDGFINQDEFTEGETTTVSVAVDREDFADGAPVTITINGNGVALTYNYSNGTLLADGAAQSTYSFDPSTGIISWEQEIPENGETLTVSATQADKAGNVSEPGSDSAQVDTAPVSAPSVTITADVNNDGLISAEEFDSQVNVTISLTDTGAVKGDTLTVNGIDIELTEAHITADKVEISVAAPEEGETLTVDATITDVAGNVSEAGSDSAVFDTLVSQPTIDLAVTSDSGDSDTDNLTNHTSVTLTLGNI
ncbi:Ig-like domain-containing protein, partial [Marinomonas pollencensis]|uniref:Ig-like domain-containing protein n=1 Tax=Marinomonas pollencensis TaxID=491954 RepID=UPI000E25254A